MSQTDLEISLFRRDAESYGVELRFTDPTSEADKRQGGVAPVRFDPAELRARALDPAVYGQYLAAQLLITAGRYARRSAGRAARRSHRRGRRASPRVGRSAGRGRGWDVGWS